MDSFSLTDCHCAFPSFLLPKVGRSCILEAAENVLNGLVTSASDVNCQFVLGGALTVQPLIDKDPRYSFLGAVDANGEYCTVCD